MEITDTRLPLWFSEDGAQETAAVLESNSLTLTACGRSRSSSNSSPPGPGPDHHRDCKILQTSCHMKSLNIQQTQKHSNTLNYEI